MNYLLRAMEAIIATASSHPDDCRCDVCRAADKDVDAIARILGQLADELDVGPSRR